MPQQTHNIFISLSCYTNGHKAIAKNTMIPGKVNSIKIIGV
jgi:hypothetical protein